MRPDRPRPSPPAARAARALAVAGGLLAAVACRGGVRGGPPPVFVPTGGAATAPPVELPPAAEPGLASDTAPRHDVEGLPNFGRVDGGLCRAGQPTADGYRTAKALGVRTVVDLRGSKEGPAATKAAGLDLVVVRTGAKRVSEADVLAFLRVATDPARRPVLVHCASGHDRTGAMVAAYRRVVDGWTADAALRELRRFGAAPWYRNLPRLIERLDPAALRARLAEPPGPAPREDAAAGPEDDPDEAPPPTAPR